MCSCGVDCKRERDCNHRPTRVIHLIIIIALSSSQRFTSVTRCDHAMFA
jgi:hypothetical protein